MNIFVYEWVCGGGFLGRDDAPPPSLLAEGTAMLAAVAGDFAKLDGVEVHAIVSQAAPLDLGPHVHCHEVASRESLSEAFDRLVVEADHTLIVAPEFEGILLGLVQRVTDLGGKSLTPSAGFVEIASDKQSTAERLFAAGVRVPRGAVLMAGERCPDGFGSPAVLKPIDGCGSLGVQLIRPGDRTPQQSLAYRLEEQAPGTPASVLCVCGPNQTVLLEPCLQRLAGQGDFTYLGGALPLEEPLRERATRLATTAIEAMPPANGFVGVDMVLGDAADDPVDVVVEINPRLTTSYVGLRTATDANLAELCLRVSNGERVDPPSFTKRAEWDATGEVRTRD